MLQWFQADSVRDHYDALRQELGKLARGILQSSDKLSLHLCSYLASCCAVLSFFGVIILMALGWGFQAEVEVR